MLRTVDQIAVRSIHDPGGYVIQLTQLGSHETIARAGIEKAQGFPFSFLTPPAVEGADPATQHMCVLVDRAVQLTPDLRSLRQQLLEARLLLGRQRGQEVILPVASRPWGSSSISPG